MSEWQDIKDAPRDGTEILTYVKNEYDEGNEILKFENHTWNNGKRGWYEENILGWMLLPEKPKKKHFCLNPEYEKNIHPHPTIKSCESINGILNLIGYIFPIKVKFCPFCGKSE